MFLQVVNDYSVNDNSDQETQNTEQCNWALLLCTAYLFYQSAGTKYCMCACVLKKLGWLHVNSCPAVSRRFFQHNQKQALSIIDHYTF